jgi:THO complex subunit 5
VAAVQECEQKKAQMIQKNAEKEKTLEEILGKVQNVFKEASLIQQSLPNSTLCVPVNDDAKLLPQPLYTLFYSASCYQQSFERKDFKIFIKGDSEAALVFAKSLDNKSRQMQSTQMMDVDSGFHKIAESKSLSESECGVVPHPLYVEVALSLADSSTVQLVFQFIPSLRLVTVLLLVSDVKVSPLLLVNLYPDDNGTQTFHHPEFAAQRCVWDRKECGVPYRWAQNLCGLHFVPSNVDNLFGRPVTLAAVLSAVQHRLLIQTSLQNQLTFLRKRTFPAQVPLSHTIKSKVVFSKWSSITVNEFPSSAHTSDEVDWWSEGSQYFSAVFTKGANLELTAFIQIAPEYPIRPPLIKLAFSKFATEVSDAGFQTDVNALAVLLSLFMMNYSIVI